VNPLALIPAGINAATTLISKWQERKAAEKSAKAKIALAKETNDYNLSLTTAEWEAISAKQKENSWTDEYATVSMLSIVNLMVVGGIELVVRGDSAVVLAGVVEGLKAMEATGINAGFLIEAVVLSAVGLHILRRAQ